MVLHLGSRRVLAGGIVAAAASWAITSTLRAPAGLARASCLAGMGSANLEEVRKNAERMHRIYHPGFEFPEWSLRLIKDPESFERLAAAVTVYYREGDSKEEVMDVATFREPVNIAMGRYYDAKALGEAFGYSHGAYAKSSRLNLMPNIAIYCLTPMRRGDEWTEAHVINVIGFAFDSPQQPDYQYFLPCREGDAKWNELVARFSQMWRYIFQCARDKRLKRVYLADVGGGAFSGGLDSEGPGYLKLKDQSLGPILREFSDIEVKQLPRIPDFAFSAEGRKKLHESLLVNAWDPWSMVGNGNAKDNSLDGFFGRCTAMALLCWPMTNPWLRCQAVKSMY